MSELEAIGPNPWTIRPMAASGVNPNFLSMKRSHPNGPRPVPEFAFSDEEPDDEVQRASVLRRQVSSVARQAAMDPGDGIDL